MCTVLITSFVQFTLHTSYFFLHTAHFTMLHCTLQTAKRPLHPAHCILHNSSACFVFSWLPETQDVRGEEHCTVHTTRCTLHSVRLTLYNVFLAHCLVHMSWCTCISQYPLKTTLSREQTTYIV